MCARDNRLDVLYSNHFSCVNQQRSAVFIEWLRICRFKPGSGFFHLTDLRAVGEQILSEWRFNGRYSMAAKDLISFRKELKFTYNRDSGMRYSTP